MHTPIKALVLSLLVSLVCTTQVHAVPTADDGFFQTPSFTLVNGNLTDFVSGFTDPDFNLIIAPAHGVVVLNTVTGAFSFTSAAGYTGPDSFGYRANEALNNTIFDTGTIFINVCVTGTCTPGRVTSVPEPTSALLLLCGIAGLGALTLHTRMRRKDS